MSDAHSAHIPPPNSDWSGRCAIVGLGETDYHRDYQAARLATKNRDAGYQAPSPESLTLTAFERALADSGLRRQDIDGLSVSYLYGGPSPQDTANLLGIKPRHLMTNHGIMAGPIPNACAAIAAGKCDTMVMIYAAATRAIGRKFGGKVHAAGKAPASYYYYHPWGWSSQAAHWALAWQYYQNTYGATEADLGQVAIAMRNHAMATDHAIMQKPLTTEDYLSSRYVVKPLHLFDLCLVNDGGVCLIIRRSDKVSDLPNTPVMVKGWGESKVTGDKLNTLVRQRLQPQFKDAGQQALDMAGLSLSEIDHFECYDAATIHLINHLEGHGFTQPGEGIEFCKAGGIDPGGALPTNMAGGMLSGSYMHGWNHIAEITRQLRHQAGTRQIADAQVSMFSLAQTDQVHPLVFTRGQVS